MAASNFTTVVSYCETSVSVSGNETIVTQTTDDSPAVLAADKAKLLAALNYVLFVRKGDGEFSDLPLGMAKSIGALLHSLAEQIQQLSEAAETVRTAPALRRVV